VGDLESKPLVRHYVKKGGSLAAVAAPPAEDAPPTTLSSTSETQIEAQVCGPAEVEIGGRRYQKRPYAPPAVGTLYLVRDKSKTERVIRVIGKSEDGGQIQVEILDGGSPPKPPIQLAVESLTRQAARGSCSVLLPIAEAENDPVAGQPAAATSADRAMMRIDSQNFGRCCADIARANIKFSTQLIKDVGDGPFRAGKYEHAFLTFEQLAVGFNAAVAGSRREIEDGRRKLTAEKGNLSGKEIQERTAAYIRSEQLIHAAEREFSTILEGLRMYLRAGQDQASSDE
jgi:hypothetical protein